MLFRSMVAATTLCGVATVAHSQNVGDMTFGAGISTFGGMIEGSYQLEPESRVRGVILGGLTYQQSETDDDGNDLAIDIGFSAGAILLDHIVPDSSFRFSFGLLFDSSEITAVASGAEDTAIEVNGQQFDAGEVTSTLTFDNRVSPIFSVGYDYAFTENWVMTSEIGAAYIGGFETTFSANSPELLEAVLDDPDFQQARADAQDINFYPFISFGVSYRF